MKKKLLIILILLYSCGEETPTSPASINYFSDDLEFINDIVDLNNNISSDAVIFAGVTVTDYEDSTGSQYYKIKKLSTENNELYGSVKPTEISKMLQKKEKIEINPSMIQPVKEIKSIGTFKVILNLHSEIQSEISVKVVPDDNIK